MTIKTSDRVFETTTSTGTGTINLAGPVAGFKSFVEGVGGGAKVPYTITQSDSNGTVISWECGIGTVTDAATDTLARNTVLRSSNSNSPVNFGAGTKNVYLGFVADIVPTRDENLNFIEGFGPVTGAANALILTLPVAPKAYSDGMVIRGFATLANTGSATINVNGLGAKTLKINGVDLTASTLTAGTYFEGVYKASTGFVELYTSRPSTQSEVLAETNNSTFVTPIGAFQGRKVLQRVRFETSSLATGTTQIPLDNSKPQQTEGNEFLTLSITPKRADSYLCVEVIGCLSSNVSSSGGLVMSLFRDSGADAIKTSFSGVGNNTAQVLSIQADVLSGSLTATTFKMRAGSGAAGTTTFNGSNGSAFYGGTMASGIWITEYAP